MEPTIQQSERKETDNIVRLYADLFLVIILLFGSAYAVIRGVPDIIRVPLTLLLTFFIPGYVLTAALFPVGDSTLPSEGTRKSSSDGITLLDRSVLSVGVSLGSVVLIGMAVDVLGYGLSAASILSSIVIVTSLLLPISFYRRSRTRNGNRFVPYPDDGISLFFEPTILSVLLVLTVVFAGGAVAFSVGVDGGDDAVTEFYFLTKTDDGTLQADDYPTNFTRGESQSLSVAVSNQEGQQQSYVVVGQLQHATRQNGTTTIQERRQVYNSSLTIPTSETEIRNISIQPTETGIFRLTFLLYLDQPPAQPNSATAYREIHLWVTVSDPTAEV